MFLQRQLDARNCVIQANPAMDTRTGIYFETVLDDVFYAKIDTFCATLNINTTKELLESSCQLAVYKVRASQGCIERLPADLAEFKDRYLTQASHTLWTAEEKIHLYALRLMVGNRHQTARCFQLLNTPRDPSAAENMMRRIHLFD